MQTLQEQIQEHTQLSGYKLTNLILRNGKKLNLKPSEVLIFATLATYYNGKPIFPRITTLSNDTNLSEKAVRTALNGLIAKGYLIKSKRARNANIYAINLSAVNSAIECGKFECTSAVNSTAPCHEVKPCISKTNNHVVSFEKSSFNHTQGTEQRNAEQIAFVPIPAILKERKDIRNLKAYWASLSVKAKNEWLDKQKEVDRLQQVKEENEKFRQKELERKERERAEFEEWNAKPLEEKYSRASAVKQVYSLRKLPNVLKKPTSHIYKLVQLYNLDVEKIFSMTPAEIEQITEN